MLSDWFTLTEFISDIVDGIDCGKLGLASDIGSFLFLFIENIRWSPPRGLMLVKALLFVLSENLTPLLCEFDENIFKIKY